MSNSPLQKEYEIVQESNWSDPDFMGRSTYTQVREDTVFQYTKNSLNTEGIFVTIAPNGELIEVWTGRRTDGSILRSLSFGFCKVN